MPKGSDYHPHNVNRGGNRIFNNEEEVDMKKRNRPKSARERKARRAQESGADKNKTTNKGKQHPGRRRK